MLTLTIFLPLIGALLVLLLPTAAGARYARLVALLFSLATFGLTIALFVAYDLDNGGFQFINTTEWFDTGSFIVQYRVGFDGLSGSLVLLTSFLTVVSVLISWGIGLRPKEYFVWLLVLETGVLGVFASLDLLLFFLFFEVELVPMFLLISIWGSGRREYSAMKFVLYTIAGSALMLVGFLALGFSAGTFDMLALRAMDLTAADLIIPLPLIFGLVLAAFAVKLPIFPLHTWLPDAHTDAPTAVSVMLAGVLLKMGGYGILRINFGIMPSVASDAAVWLAALGAVNIVYGALVTMRQQDLKRLIAYSSVSHMGFVLLGAAALGQVGVTGAAVQMLTHGAVTGMLFVMVGLVYERTHTRQIAELGGLAKQMPFIATFMMVASLASLGLPSLAGFVGEFIVFSGAYDAHPALTLVGIGGVVLSAGYLLWTMQRAFFGPSVERWSEVGDAKSWWEQAPVAALALATLAVGVYPAFMVDVVSRGVEPIVARLG